MSISNTVRKAGPFTCNGVTQAFPFAFKVFQTTDVVATLVDSVGNVTTLVLGTDYAVTLSANQDVSSGGTVTTTVTYAAGYFLTLTSAVPAIQPIDLTNTGGFYPDVLNDEFDRLTILIQQSMELLSRALSMPAGDVVSAILPAAAARAGLYLGFDGSGAPVAVAGVGAVPTLAQLTYKSPITGSVNRTVTAKIAEGQSVLDFGADGTGAIDAAGSFTLAATHVKQVEIPAGTFDLASVPTTPGTTTWDIAAGVTFSGASQLSYVEDRIVSRGGSYRSVESSAAFYSAVFGYLEQNAALTGYGSIGLHGAASSLGNAGSANDASIAVAGFAANNNVGGLQGAWGLYATVVRTAGVLGPTHGAEIDIANMGTLSPAYPGAPNPQGMTEALRLAAGGEVTDVGGSPAVVSVALSIVRNDGQTTPTTSFDKGILFGSNAISGTDGTTGTGVAIAFSSKHAQVWYNTSNQVVAEITCSGVSAATDVYRIDFSDAGLLVQNIATGSVALQIGPTPNTAIANGIQIIPGLTGVPPIISPKGSDTNIDLALVPVGTGNIKFGNYTAGAVTATGYVPFKTADGTVRKMLVA